MDSIKYNEVSSSYYGQNLTLYHPETGALTCTDTVRNWWNWPHYKIFTNDVQAEANMGSTRFDGASYGGNADRYLYRLAETYLLRYGSRRRKLLVAADCASSQHVCLIISKLITLAS